MLCLRRLQGLWYDKQGGWHMAATPRTALLHALRVLRAHPEVVDRAVSAVPAGPEREALQMVLDRLVRSARDRTEWWTPAQVGRLLGASPDTVRRWCMAGRLPGYRTPGGHWRIPYTALADAVAWREALDAVTAPWRDDPDTQFDG